MAPGSSRQSPDVVAAAHQAQIEKLERAIGVLGEDNVDAAGLVATLKRLRTQTTQPVGERLDACQQFVERAKKRLAAAEQAVTKALETKSRLEAELSEGMQRLQRLREEAVASALVDQKCHPLSLRRQRQKSTSYGLRSKNYGEKEICWCQGSKQRTSQWTSRL